jgi:hypothetical protein
MKRQFNSNYLVGLVISFTLVLSFCGSGIIRGNPTPPSDYSLSYKEGGSRLYIYKAPSFDVTWIGESEPIYSCDDKTFNHLEEDIFDFLRKQNLKTDKITIYYMYSGVKDKYGRDETPFWRYLGEMDVSDIKKYKDFAYFKNNSGWSLKKMIKEQSLSLIRAN